MLEHKIRILPVFEPVSPPRCLHIYSPTLLQKKKSTGTQKRHTLTMSPLTQKNRTQRARSVPDPDTPQIAKNKNPKATQPRRYFAKITKISQNISNKFNKRVRTKKRRLTDGQKDTLDQYLDINNIVSEKRREPRATLFVLHITPIL